MTTERKLRLLREQLQGHLTDIAKAENVAISTISRILSGARKNNALLAKIVQHRDVIVGKKKAEEAKEKQILSSVK